MEKTYTLHVYPPRKHRCEFPCCLYSFCCFISCSPDRKLYKALHQHQGTIVLTSEFNTSPPITRHAVTFRTQETLDAFNVQMTQDGYRCDMPPPGYTDVFC